MFIGRSGYGDSGGDALRATGRAEKPLERFTGCQICGLERHETLGELRKSVNREGYGGQLDTGGRGAHPSDVK